MLTILGEFEIFRNLCDNFFPHLNKKFEKSGKFCECRKSAKIGKNRENLENLPKFEKISTKDFPRFLRFRKFWKIHKNQ